MPTLTRTRAGSLAAVAVALLAGGCTLDEHAVEPASPPSPAVVVEPVTVTLADGRGDMYAAAPREHPVPAPEQRHGDMRQVVIASGTQSIVVGVQFDELSRTGVMSELDVHLRTDTAVRRMARLFLGQISTRGWTGDIEFNRPGAVGVECTVPYAVDYRENTIDLEIDRSCLGEPRWVQARVVSSFGDNQARIYVDKSQTDQVKADVWTQRIGG